MNNQTKASSFAYTLIISILFIGCERDLDSDLPLATYPNTAEIFTDIPIGMGSDFYFPYLGSKPDAWSLDNNESYEGTTSMRFDVPNADDPEGNYAGAIFRIDGVGRDLSEYDALTFWAKSSQGITVGEFGFGEDFGENKFQTTVTNVNLGTAWQKIIIPIPSASKLLNERGVFRYSAGTQETDGNGYTFWVDELKFETLGNIAHPRTSIYNGKDVIDNSFTGVKLQINPISQTWNLGTGQEVQLSISPSYLTFNSSDTNVATVDYIGEISVLNAGTTIITATVDGEEVIGSLTLTSNGDFVHAPTPTLEASEVISIFSDSYSNIPVDFFNGFWEPYQTTTSADFEVNGDNVLNYLNFNFVGNQFSSPTIDAILISHIHFDVFVPDGTVAPQLKITLKDFGPDGADGNGDDSTISETFSGADLVAGQWNSLEIQISNLATRDKFGQIIYENVGSGLEAFYLDNIYLYNDGSVVPQEPSEAAPTPTLPVANVISLYSDAYTDVSVDTWRTSWSAPATVLTDIEVAGNPTKKYTDLGFVGVETTASKVDASSMTHFHIDIWSPDITEFKIKIVDFGADGAFGGGDDSEHEITVTPSPAQGEWVSLDIPLSDFTNLTGRTNIAQYIFVGSPYEVTDVFVDNVYFHN